MTVDATKIDPLDAVRRMGLDPANPEDIRRAAIRIRALRARVAYDDPNVFNAYVLRDERNGAPIEQAPMHEEWQELLTRHDRVCLWSHVEGGKTNQIAIGRVLFELGRDPNLRVCVISNTNELAKKMTRQVGQYIQKSPELHEVFPHLVPTKDPSLPWRAQALTIARQGMGGKDPSIQACGVHGNIIGSRVDLFVFDDILDYENTNTPGPRDDVYRWVKNVMGRGTEKVRVWVVGNAWHPDDAMHRLEKDGFRSFRFPVVSPTNAITWPARWPRERIERARGQDGFGPLEFARQLMCQARDDTSARFKKEWVDKCVGLGTGMGYHESLASFWDEQALTEEEREEAAKAETVWRLSGKVPEGVRVITGVDLAVSRAASADFTVLFTIYVDAKGVRRILNIRAGKWTGPEIVAQIKRTHADFGGLFIVENNAAQQYIVDEIVETTAIPVVPFTTGKNKAHHEYGVESLATELANGKWRIPNKRALGPGVWEPMHPECLEWMAELLFYDPKEHTGDRLMASWLAREGARRFCDGVSSSGVNARTF